MIATVKGKMNLFRALFVFFPRDLEVKRPVLHFSDDLKPAALEKASGSEVFWFHVHRAEAVDTRSC